MRAVRVLAGIAGLLVALCAGLWLGGHPAQMPPPLRSVFVDEEAGVAIEAAELIEDNYYREVSARELANASLQGMARGLRKRYDDRFSEYFSPEIRARFDEAISGRFSGIGLSVTGVEDGLRVEFVFKGSPAQEAGIEVGDTIVSVEGEALAGVGAVQATEKIKGPEGTDVTVGVRGEDGKTRELTITREEISLPVVSGRTIERGGRTLGYVRYAAFSRGSHAFLRRVTARLLREGAEGIVLDMRSNGGGLFQEAVLAASIFLPEGTPVVSTKSRTEGEASYSALGGNLPPFPLVVLVDGNTASSAEILTAALAERADAEVVGAETFGKGVFQREMVLANGGAMKLTVGEYFTPDGVNLAGDGIDPDVPARDRPGTARDEAVGVALRELARDLDRGSG